MQKNIFRNCLVVGIIMLFIGASVIPSMGNSIVVKQELQENKTTFKDTRSGGYIQDLIDNASDGDTIYIPSGTYYECIVINKSISLVGEDKDTTIIDGNYIGDVVYVSADWVNISGFTIQNSGFYFPFINFGIGILSNNNTITGNTISNNDHGIDLFGSGNNITDNNIISNNGNGILLFSSSSNNIIIGNNISSNNYRGISLSSSCNNNIITVNNITNNMGGIYLSDSSNTIITGNIISSNNGHGICLQYYSESNTIANNTCNSNNESGIYLVLSNNNIISGNNCSLNAGNGIYLKYSRGCVIDGNTVNDNKAVYELNTTGLVGYWKMDEPSWNGTLGEVLDSSGNGNNGTAVNDANTTAFGMLGRAGEFDGVNDYIEVADDDTLDISKVVTLTVWIYIANLKSNTWHTLCAKNTLPFLPSLEDRNYGLFIHKTGYVHLSYVDSYNQNINLNTQNGIIQEGKWYFIVGIIDSNLGTMEIYIDSQSIISRNIFENMVISDSTLYIGKHNDMEGEHYTDGRIDEVRIYNRALSAEEVLAHYNQFIATDGIHLEQSENNIITNNTCQVNKNGINLDSSSNNNIVNNNTCLNNQCGINLNSSSNSNLIANNICNFNKVNGINIGDSSSNTIIGNNISNNWDGIYLYESSDSNTILGNNISNNREGIHIFQSKRNNIKGNTIDSNDQDGLYLHDSSSNTISDNIISSNINDGIYLYYSDYNNIINNTISNNGYGITQYHNSYDNNIYHNNLINNNQNGYDPYKNNWYNSLLQEGNYWSDYTGSDLNHDGIGDKPYNITGGSNQDLYPFMEPDGWLKKPEFQKTFIFGRITNLSSQGEYITFEAVKILVITFKPFSFNKYVSGEKLILSKNYLGLIGVRYIFALCEIVIKF